MLLLTPFAFVGFLFGWLLVGGSGILIFSLAAVSGIFLDTIRFMYHFVTGDESEDPKNRLRKGARIIVQIWMIMGDLKETGRGEIDVALLA